jgi:hypothetical protein
MYCQFRRLNPTTTTARNQIIPTTVNNPSSICAFVVCQNGGICNAIDESRFICLCQLGYSGQFCQNQVTPTPLPTPTTTAGFSFDICQIKNCQNGIRLFDFYKLENKYRIRILLKEEFVIK